MRSQDVITEKQREIRKADLQHQEEKRDRERLEAQKNQNFTQVYPLAGNGLQSSLKAILRHLGFIPILPNTSMVLAALSLQTKHFLQNNSTSQRERYVIGLNILRKCTL